MPEEARACAEGMGRPDQLSLRSSGQKAEPEVLRGSGLASETESCDQPPIASCLANVPAPRHRALEAAGQRAGKVLPDFSSAPPELVPAT